MGANTILFAAVLSLVILAQAPKPTVVRETSGGSAILPCDGSASRGQLNILWQTSEGKLVANYSQGEITTGSHFDNRVTFFLEKLKDGNFSLTINPVKLSDDNNYECVWGKGQRDQRVLKDVKLYVLVPPVPNSLSVRAGELVTLPCLRIIPKWSSEPLHLVWKRGEELVVELRSEEITYGKMYEGRASVSPSLIQDGNFSLTINSTGLCDAGEYTCVSGPKQRATSVKLEIKDYGRFKPVNVSLGKPFSLSLPSVPVVVNFSRNGTLPAVSLCFSDTGGQKCDLKYLQRMKWESGNLTMLNVTFEDVGTYTVIHTENCVIDRAYILNIKPPNDRNRNYLVIGIGAFFILFLCALCIVCVRLYKKKQNYSGVDKCSVESMSMDSSEDLG